MKKTSCLPLGYLLKKRSAALKAGRITSLTLTLLLLIATVVPALVHPGVVHADDDNFTKLADPEDLPNGTASGVAFGYYPSYMAVSHSMSPFVTIYKISGDTFTKLSNPAILPGDNANGIAFSPNATYLAVASLTSPYITIYKRSSDNFTKLADPATLPTGTGYGVDFSHDSNYLAIAHVTSPYVTIYKRTGDNFTKLADPVELPTASGHDVAFSHDSTFMAVAHISSPYVTIYKRTGDTFTKLADPTDLPGGSGWGVDFSPNNTYLTVVYRSSPYVTIYKRSINTFTKLTGPEDLPAGEGYSVDFSHDSNYMAVGHFSSPYVTIYKRSGDTFTKLANPATLPAGYVVGVDFSHDSTYMAAAHNTSPSVTIYKRSVDTDEIGIWRGSTRYFYLDMDSDFTYDGAATERFGTFLSSTDASDVAIAGDWDGDALDEIGVWRGSTRYFYLDMDGDGIYDGAATERFGPFLSSTVANDVPVAGDWDSDNKDEIGIWRGSTRYFYLDMDGDGTYDGATTERIGTFLSSTDASDRPVAGDWDGDTYDEIGVWRGSTRYFYLDVNGNGTYDGATAERFGPFLSSTDASDRPVAGDWNGDVSDKIGVWRGSTRYFYLDMDEDGIYDGKATERFGTFLSSTVASDRPVAGDWDGL